MKDRKEERNWTGITSYILFYFEGIDGLSLFGFEFLDFVWTIFALSQYIFKWIFLDKLHIQDKAIKSHLL